MFQFPISFSNPMPVTKWFWKKGKNKMLFPDERVESSELGEYKELLKSEIKSPKDTLLIEFLRDIFK